MASFVIKIENGRLEYAFLQRLLRTAGYEWSENATTDEDGWRYFHDTVRIKVRDDGTLMPIRDKRDADVTGAELARRGLEEIESKQFPDWRGTFGPYMAVYYEERNRLEVYHTPSRDRLKATVPKEDIESLVEYFTSDE